MAYATRLRESIPGQYASPSRRKSALACTGGIRMPVSCDDVAPAGRFRRIASPSATTGRRFPVRFDRFPGRSARASRRNW